MTANQDLISLNVQYDMPFVYRLEDRPAIADRRSLWLRFKKALFGRDMLSAYIPHEVYRPETLVDYPCFGRSGYSQAMLQIMAL
jgi:hypothetical protein